MADNTWDLNESVFDPRGQKGGIIGVLRLEFVDGSNLFSI